MSTVKEIEEAITCLSEPDLKALRIWFDEYASTSWDTQIERDVLSGKLDLMAESALNEFN